MANIPYTGGTGSTSYSLKSGCESVTVGARSEATWITITSVGNGSINYNVSANAGSERTGYITPTVNGVSCSSNKFSVTQNGVPAPSCTCTSLTLASTTASVTVGSTTDVAFTADCTTGHIVASSDETVATATVGNGKVTITGVKAGTATITLSYKAGTTSSCSSAITATVTTACGCNNFAISPTSLEWEASSTAPKEVSITESGSCISGVQVSSSNSHFTASISGSKITVTPTAATSSSEETGTLTVSYKANGSDCTPSKTVSLRHKATTCECTSLTLVSTTASVTVGSTTDVVFTADCTTGHIVASSDETVATATVGNGKVTITGVKAGTATITLSYKAGTTSSCSSAITATVTTACTCNNFAISPTSLEWEASSTAPKEVSITESGSCISGVQVSSSNSHFTASISGSKITVTPTAATSSSEETGTLTVSYKANGSDCTPSKTVSLRHKATTCECTSLTVQSTATVTAGTSIEIPYTANCVNVGEITASSDYIDIDTSTPGKIKVTGNTKGSATIYIKSSVNETSCEDRKITVTIKCPTITINPPNGSCKSSGGTQTFTINQ